MDIVYSVIRRVCIPIGEHWWARYFLIETEVIFKTSGSRQLKHYVTFNAKQLTFKAARS